MPRGRVPLKVAPKLKELLHDYYQDVQAAADDPQRRVAWVSGTGPVEIVRAHGSVSFPASLRHKGLGLVATISCLQIVNYVRIVSLYFLGSHFDEEIFHTVHKVVWPILLILIAIATWVLWARWVGEHED